MLGTPEPRSHVSSGEIVIDNNERLFFLIFLYSAEKGNDYYHQVDNQDVPVEDKIKPTEKFEKKYLVWQETSSDGQLPYSFITEGTITGSERKSGNIV